MTRFALLLLPGLLACSPTESTDSGLDDDWWKGEDSAEAGTGGEADAEDEEEDGEDAGEGEPAFIGYFFEEGDQWYGAVEVFTDSCTWAVEVTGTSAAGCTDCLVSIAFTTGSPEVERDDCDGELSDFAPEDWRDTSYTVGLAEDAALVLIEDEWLPFAESFFEGEMVGWYLPLE
ncbi:MAG: hypothetical protein VX265_01515 [Myxococcota bacterium]|nr:hypothetical protein [Myxococcota bacterium]